MALLLVPIGIISQADGSLTPPAWTLVLALELAGVCLLLGMWDSRRFVACYRVLGLLVFGLCVAMIVSAWRRDEACWEHAHWLAIGLSGVAFTFFARRNACLDARTDERATVACDADGFTVRTREGFERIRWLAVCEVAAVGREELLAISPAIRITTRQASVIVAESTFGFLDLAQALERALPITGDWRTRRAPEECLWRRDDALPAG
ncbi:MAG TPA: hypothetical protein VEL07_20940 [Planctomycetota bacterium]|nr:hypothetical protein [Planctomycetota bacterium]